jgi:hypothetical protein
LASFGGEEEDGVERFLCDSFRDERDDDAALAVDEVDGVVGQGRVDR